VDPIRILTNRASGKTGTELALEAYRRGAEVTIVHRNRLEIDGIREISVESAKQMTDAVLEELSKGYDLLISAAAIGDYTLDAAGTKIKSGGEPVLSLRPTRKLIKEARAAHPEIKIIGFKAETGISKEELFQRALRTLNNSNLDMIIANEVSAGGMGTDDNSIYMIRPERKEHINISGPKSAIADTIMDEITQMLSKGDKH
jgi:phosphopantothenoylcysteine decarboxylase/phosphopantothenate--cysteine ligase